jgi:hypothetical protein
MESYNTHTHTHTLEPGEFEMYLKATKEVMVIHFMKKLRKS